MKNEKAIKMQFWMRCGIGGLLGVLILPRYGNLLNTMLLAGGEGEMEMLFSFLLYFSLGVLIALSTLPFSSSGGKLLLHSLLHYALTAATFAALCVLNGWNRGRGDTLLVQVGVLGGFYLLIWLLRWISWLGDIIRLRERLGIAPKPSPFGFLESLPYAALLFLAALLVSLVGFGLDHTGFFGSMLTLLMLPAVAFFAGLVQARRSGFSPALVLLAELAMVAGFGIPTLLLHLHLGFGWAVALPAVSALLGSLLGAGMKKLAHEN
ncbi:MAG: DUF3021 family protein [bacterium]